MQAQKERTIKSGEQYNKLFPRSIRQDKVIRSEGKAQLHHTINLIKQIVQETKGDTRLLANYLEGESLPETCRNIWNFVYQHIQYTRDKTGVEQVRRPSRTWADRKKGVDCDCYSVFIASILTNLRIPHRVRITKYGGKPHFQHIYPIVPDGTGYITLDCVTDYFDYEVPYSEARDFDTSDPAQVSEISGLREVSGVDSADLLTGGLGIYQLKQPKLSLRSSVKNSDIKGRSDKIIIKRVAEPTTVKQSQRNPFSVSPAVAIKPPASPEPSTTIPAGKSSSGLIIKLLLAVGVGLGTYKLLESAN